MTSQWRTPRLPRQRQRRPRRHPRPLSPPCRHRSRPREATLALARAPSIGRVSAQSPSCPRAGRQPRAARPLRLWAARRWCRTWAPARTLGASALLAATTTSSTSRPTSLAGPSSSPRTWVEQAAAATPRSTLCPCARTHSLPRAPTTTAMPTASAVLHARRLISWRPTSSHGTPRCTPPATTVAWESATVAAAPIMARASGLARSTPQAVPAWTRRSPSRCSFPSRSTGRDR
mmetsp:Transcript_99962/g.278379  ORF Transcript_99962/g.278379 Transcript_99962/m.278379 type:complete len:233 (+) Transcript_99962:461-1159(+)